MDNRYYKEVYFHKYCPTCKNRKVGNTEAPCDECLGEPLNLETNKPVKYEKKETK